MRVPPTPAQIREVPDWEWHKAGVDHARRRAILAAALVAHRLERAVELGGGEGRALLRHVPGIGVWTAAEVAQRAWGDPDAVSFGDFHIPTVVGWALLGRPLDDVGLAEVLAPYAPQRQRAVQVHRVVGLPPSPVRAPLLAARLPRDVARRRLGRVRITVLVGGVGGARFLLGVRELPDVEVTAVVNVGDDIWLHGLRICPDLDTCMYTLGGGIDTERGWGRSGETWAVRDELAAYGADPDWFGLGDRDTATHLVRTRMLRAGYPLSDVTAALCHRWQPGVTLLPASDDRVETHVVVDDPANGPKAQKAIHFQEWWIRHKGELPAHRFASVGAEQASVLPAAPRRHPRRRRRAVRAVQPGRVGRRHPRRAGRARGAARHAGEGGGALADRRAGARCAAWPTPASTRSAWRPPPRAWGGTSAPAPTAASSTAGSCTPATRPTCPGSTSAPVPLLMTDVPATTAMARAALDVAGCLSPRRPQACRRARWGDGCARPRPGARRRPPGAGRHHRAPGAGPARVPARRRPRGRPSPPPRPGWPTATSWSSRPRCSPKWRDGSWPPPPTRRSAIGCAASSSTPRPSGWSPAVAAR
jgi:LPPG:FO 2-phospho-L-lactate transferase